tara:strand:- start:2239 stop:2538 length:300 start_codon:yes stop_codon:yes gene_type:complete
MAKIELADGRKIPLVKPTAWDGVEVERETGWDRKKFAEMMNFASVQSAYGIFASLRRAGVETTFEACMQYEGFSNILAEPSDLNRAEGEGEQSPDPQPE